MANPARRKGTGFETALIDYLRKQGYEADGLKLSGAEDEGDVVLRMEDGRRFIFEAKNRVTLDLPSYLREAETEADNYREHRGLYTPVHWAAVHKRRGTTDMGKQYVSLDLAEYLRTIT